MLNRVVFNIDKKLEDEITEKLFAIGASSVSVTGNSGNCIKLEAIIDNDYISLINSNFDKNSFKISEIENEDWVNKWTDNFEGIEINDKINIIPENKQVHDPKNIKPGQIVIKLDPCDAFGNGTHATTFLCLNMLDEIIKENNVKFENLLDIGTGTGVLAICASLLGVNKIDAFDYCKKSVFKAKHNIDLNNCKNINIFQSDLYNIDNFNKKYNLVTANILTKVIIDNIDKVVKLTKNDGYIIFSGISKEWKDEIELLFIKNDLKIIKNYLKDNWLAYLVQKK